MNNVYLTSDNRWQFLAIVLVEIGFFLLFVAGNRVIKSIYRF